MFPGNSRQALPQLIRPKPVCQNFPPLPDDTFDIRPVLSKKIQEDPVLTKAVRYRDVNLLTCIPNGLNLSDYDIQLLQNNQPRPCSLSSLVVIGTVTWSIDSRMFVASAMSRPAC